MVYPARSFLIARENAIREIFMQARYVRREICSLHAPPTHQSQTGNRPTLFITPACPAC